MMHVRNLPVEVFVLILKLLESRDLLRCATVCSQWKDLALDVKWKEHDLELVDMLGVLGPIEPSSTDKNIFSFTTKHSSIEDAVASAGWRRLNDLRKKVTQIRVQKLLALSDINYVMDIHRAVESPHHPFCPKLRRLGVKLDPQSQGYAYDFLAGRSLTKLKFKYTFIKADAPPNLVANAMERMALRAPMVEQIVVPASDSPFIDYGKFSSLRSLIHEGDFSMKSWSQLCAGCPMLEVVSLQWMRETLVEYETIYSAPEIQPPPALRFLEVCDSEDGVPSSCILRNTNMPELRLLEVDLKQQAAAETDMLFSRIKKYSPLLETLRVAGDRLEWGSFASFTGLRELELSGDLGSFTPKQMARIIGNIPNIVRLGILSSNDHIDRTKVAFTPVLLESIAKRCHQLSDLGVPLDTLSISWASKPPTPACEFKILQALALDPLHIEPRAMEPVAKYLAQLCPTVKTFDCVLLHPHETGTVDVDLDSFSEDESRNVAEMENLFFDFQEGDGIWESASQ